MKKLFTLTGVFAGIYLVFLFILFSSSLIFPNTQGQLYDCMLEKTITANELSSISNKYKITTFTTEYKNTSFFEKDITFNYFNNSDVNNIRYGLQKKIIRANKILYEENSNEELKIQRFWAINNNEANFKLFSEDLKEYVLQKEAFESHRMNFSIVFAERNIEFFICVIMFLIFCVSIYYVLRSKEIAILKLNGYNIFVISMKILAKAVQQITIGYTIIGLAFIVYLTLLNGTLIADFLRLYMYIFICLFVAMLVICIIGAIFIKILKIIPALKNNKNNKILIILVVAFKVAITGIFIFSATHLCNDYLDYKLTTEGYESIESKNFNYIKTSKTPDENLMENILIAMEKSNLEDIYNYSNPSYSLNGHEVFNNTKKREEMITNPPVIRMSHNMLKYVNIYSEDNSVIDVNSFDNRKTIILLPNNLKNRENEILKKYDDISNSKVIYIKDKQEHFNFLRPNEKVYNAIYLLKPIERSIYFNNGRVVFGKESTAKMEKYLLKIGADKGTVQLINLESEHKKMLDNMQLKLIDNIQLFLINTLSFFLAIIAVGIVYCEFRKKEIAIMKVSSQKPLRVIFVLCSINVAITTVISLILNPLLCTVCGLEIVIYILIVYLYYSRKAISVLKGE
ncbi:TPA: hypothetical protein V0M64_000574 [Streptococcus pneumoniae]|nr:hypothetical protein [Streptococcus pneumoniae]